MFKLIVKGIATCCLFSPTVLASVSCSQDQFDLRYWVITDSGYITDNSFNESVYNGATQFVKSQNPNKPNIKAAYIEPKSGLTSDLLESTNIAKTLGSQISVLSGYRFSSLDNEIAANNKKIIQVDAAPSVIPRNLSSIVFKSSISGFLASLTAGEFYGNAVSKQTLEFPRLSTFGGLPSPVAVNNYMWGFLAGISFWNYIISTKGQSSNPVVTEWYKLLSKTLPSAIPSKQKSPGAMLRKLNLSPVQGDVEEDGTFTKLNISSVNPVPTRWFSGSFTAGKARSISNLLISNNANCIMAVAGFQTNDVIQRFESIKPEPFNKAIGVDSDQSKLFGKRWMITSALKELSTATDDALQAVKNETVKGPAPKNSFLGHVKSTPAKPSNPDTPYYKWSWNGVAAQGPDSTVNQKFVNLIEYGSDNPQQAESKIYKNSMLPVFNNLVKTYTQVISESQGGWYQTCEDTQKLIYKQSKLTTNNWGEYLATISKPKP